MKLSVYAQIGLPSWLLEMKGPCTHEIVVEERDWETILKILSSSLSLMWSHLYHYIRVAWRDGWPAILIEQPKPSPTLHSQNPTPGLLVFAITCLSSLSHSLLSTFSLLYSLKSAIYSSSPIVQPKRSPDLPYCLALSLLLGS